VVRIGDHAAPEIAGRTGHVRQRVADATPRAGLGRGDGQAGLQADLLEALGERAQIGLCHSRAQVVRSVRFGGAGGWKSHVSGEAPFPRAPRLVPLRV